MEEPQTLAPGWYPDGVHLRWWDGVAWGPPVLPPPPRGDNQRALAMVAHIGGFTGGFLVPLILFIVEKDRESLARHHAAEALNFQLTVMLAQFVCFALAFATFGVQLASASSSGALDDGTFFPWSFFLLFPLFFLLMGANIVLSIIGIVKANHLERWRYPLSFRFVKP